MLRSSQQHALVVVSDEDGSDQDADEDDSSEATRHTSRSVPVLVARRPGQPPYLADALFALAAAEVVRARDADAALAELMRQRCRAANTATFLLPDGYLPTPEPEPTPPQPRMLTISPSLSSASSDHDDGDAAAGDVTFLPTGSKVPTPSPSPSPPPPPAPLALDVIRAADSSFPPPDARGRFQASAFQRAVLEHMQRVRDQVGHSIGLAVMATAAGKTVLAILDTERQIAAAHAAASPIRGGNGQPQQQQQQQQQCQGDSTDAGDFAPPMLPARKRQRRLASRAPIKLLFLVHTRAIRDNAYAKFKLHFQQYSESLFLNLMPTMRQHELSRGARRASFVFCLFQSFDKVPPDVVASFTHVVVDEVHHLLAATYRQVYASLMQPGHALLSMLGMTATLFHRTDPDGTALRALFRNVLYIDFPWNIAKQLDHYPAVEYLEVLPTLQDGRDVRTYAQLVRQLRVHRRVTGFLRDLDRSLALLQLKTTEQIRRSVTPSFVVSVFLQYQQAMRENNLPCKQRIIIFAATTSFADDIASQLSSRGISAAAAHSKLGMDRRSRQPLAVMNCQRFASGKLTVLVACMMLTEGFDIPAVDMVIMARGTESELVFVQQIGRGLRRDKDNPDKEVTVLDLSLNLRRRWRRLQAERADARLYDEILAFWPVGNFVGLSLLDAGHVQASERAAANPVVLDDDNSGDGQVSSNKKV